MFDRGALQAPAAKLLLFTVYIHSPRDLGSAFRPCRLAESGGLARVLFEILRDCTLVVVLCTFSGLVITFRGRRKGYLVFWSGPKSTFRDRWMRSEWFYVDEQISWQVRQVQ